MEDKKISCEMFIQKLCEKCSEEKIELSEEKAEKLYRYMIILLEWNQKINLTAITDIEEIMIKHFLDCLECTKCISEEKNIIDIGTGAGFPGLVLAIYYPQKQFTLLDALNKRLVFLKEVIDTLQLKNVELIHARAEEAVREKNMFDLYDASVSRAVANLPVLLEYVSSYVKVDGYCIIMKGDSIEQEIELASNALNVLNLKICDKLNYSYNVNNEVYNRNILKIKKLKQTPLKYPRNHGKIKKSPL